MHTRPARREDLDTVLDLYCRYEERFRGAPDSDPGDITEDWDSPGFDMATQTLVLERDGRAVAYGIVAEDGWADTAIDPDLDVAALAQPLLDWLEGKGQRLEHYVADTDPALADVLRDRGWEPARVFWRMRVAHDAPPAAAVWPEGVEVRDYRRPDDDEAVHALITRSFTEIGGETERTLEAWRSFLVETDRFDPSLYLVAVADGEVVGASLSQLAGDYGFVRQLAVAPSQRGRGLGLALLQESFVRHHARGCPATQLGVNAANPTGALQLYERAGMRVHESFTRWERPAPPR